MSLDTLARGTALRRKRRVCLRTIASALVIVCFGLPLAASAQGKKTFTIGQVDTMLFVVRYGVPEVLQLLRDKGCLDAQVTEINALARSDKLSLAQRAALGAGLNEVHCKVARVELSTAPGRRRVGSVVMIDLTSLTSAGMPLQPRDGRWATSDASIAAIPDPAKGVVHLRAPGRAQVTATVDGVSGVINLEVVSAIAFAVRDTTLQQGLRFQVRLTSQPSEQVSWWSEGDAVEVTATGYVTAIRAGKARVIASLPANLGADTVDVTVVAPIVAVPASPQPAIPLRSPVAPQANRACPDIATEVSTVIKALNEVGNSKPGLFGYREWPRWRAELRELTKGNEEIKFKLSGDELEVKQRLRAYWGSLGKWKVVSSCDENGNNIFELRKLP